MIARRSLLAAPALLLSRKARAWIHGGSIPVTLMIFIGDSNETGEQLDGNTLSYTPDPLTLAWNGTAWARYVPNVNPGFSPNAGLTELNFESPDGNWGPETAVIQAFRAANPTTLLAVFKNTAPGSFASWVSGQSVFISWDVTNGTLYGSATTQLTAALAWLRAHGLSPTLKLVNIGLGGNDATTSANGAAFTSALTALVGAIVTSWGFVTGTTKIILNRPQTVTGSFATEVRAGVVTVGGSQSYTNWVNTDSIPVVSPSDEHYTAAGQLALGALIWGEYP